jgi:hypothetical protein
VLSGAPTKETPEYKVLRCSFLLADGLLVNLRCDPRVCMAKKFLGGFEIDFLLPQHGC